MPSGARGFDELFDEFEERESERESLRKYLARLPSGVDHEIGLYLHSDNISERATDADLLATLARADLRGVASLYGDRAYRAAARAATQGNYSALRCFLREVRRARDDMMMVATSV